MNVPVNYANKLAAATVQYMFIRAGSSRLPALCIALFCLASITVAVFGGPRPREAAIVIAILAGLLLIAVPAGIYIATVRRVNAMLGGDTRLWSETTADDFTIHMATFRASWALDEISRLIKIGEFVFLSDNGSSAGLGIPAGLFPVEERRAVLSRIRARK